MYGAEKIKWKKKVAAGKIYITTLYRSTSIIPKAQYVHNLLHNTSF